MASQWLNALLVAAVTATVQWQAAADQCTATSATGICLTPPPYGCDIKTGAKCCRSSGAWANCPVCSVGALTPSALYGCVGELFSRSNSRLLDWSYAGYWYGDYNLPRLPVMANMKTVFGAKGDGVTDDTAAFFLAISTIANQGTLFLPAGVYVVTKRLDIDKRIFFQGEGAGRTVFYFPQSLQDVYGNSYVRGISQYAFGPGFINFNGADFPDNNTVLARITAGATRGTTMLQLNTTAGIEPGQMVRVVLDNVNNTLLTDLNQNMFPAFAPYNNRADVIRWTSKVKAVYASTKRIELERVLPFDVDLAWRPELHDFVNGGYGLKRNFTGLADLTIRFPGNQAYPGENKEVGYNGLYFYGTSNSWLKNVVFENAEFGVAFDSGSFNTVENVTFMSTKPTSASNPYTGTRGIWNKGTFDNLINGFFFKTRLKYELSTSYFALGNVYANGIGIDMTIEMMYAAAYGNLFSNIHLGAASEPFGWNVRGQDASAYNTFWNIRTAADVMSLPPSTWAPKTTFVSTRRAQAPGGSTSVDWYVESRTNVWPYDLWAAMRKARGRPINPPVPIRWSGPGYGCFSNGTKCCLAVTAGCPRCPANYVQPSRLWGCTGELWTPRDRLVFDWGWAGYKASSQTPPKLPVTKNLKTQYGAKGNGVADDTQALLKAIYETAKGVIYFPAGVYILTSVINIRKPIILRGEGRSKTVLRFPKSLTDLYGNSWVEGKWIGTSQYSHGTGFINIGGWDPTGRDFTKITWITQNCVKGERILKVASTASITVGQWYRVFQKDPGDGSLMFALNGDAYPIVNAQKGHPDPCRFLARVVSKGTDWIRLERPVPFKIQTRWSPEIHKFMPMINDNVGMENFTLEFPWSKYPGHFLEQGYNGLHLNQVVNGWVRGVTVVNSDMGLYLWGCVWTQVDDIILTNSVSRGWYNGHRGMWMEHGSDCLIKNFQYTDRFVHDITICGTEHGTVFMNGGGYDINLDHHRSSPYQNLFTNIDLGLGTRVFVASGDKTWGSHSAYYTTFHNLKADLRYSLPESDFGPNLTFIGLPTDDPADPRWLGWFVELLNKPYPPNLYIEFARTRTWRNPRA